MKRKLKDSLTMLYHQLARGWVAIKLRRIIPNYINIYESYVYIYIEEYLNTWKERERAWRVLRHSSFTNEPGERRDHPSHIALDFSCSPPRSVSLVFAFSMLAPRALKKHFYFCTLPWALSADNNNGNSDSMGFFGVPSKEKDRERGREIDWWHHRFFFISGFRALKFWNVGGPFPFLSNIQNPHGDSSVFMMTWSTKCGCIFEYSSGAQYQKDRDPMIAVSCPFNWTKISIFIYKENVSMLMQLLLFLLDADNVFSRYLITWQSVPCPLHSTYIFLQR